jgi:hypothetical protein
MSTVYNAIEKFLSEKKSLDLGSGDHFRAGLQRAGKRNRAIFWVITAFLAALFLVVLWHSSRSFDELSKSVSTGVVGGFGVGATGAVTLLIRVAREWHRADLLLVLLDELKATNPQQFTHLVTALAEKWYGLKPRG